MNKNLHLKRIVFMLVFSVVELQSASVVEPNFLSQIKTANRAAARADLAAKRFTISGDGALTDPAWMSDIKVQHRPAVRAYILAFVRDQNPDPVVIAESSLSRATSMSGSVHASPFRDRLQPESFTGSGSSPQPKAPATAAASGGVQQQQGGGSELSNQQPSQTVTVVTSDAGRALLEAAKSAGLASRWRTDEQIEANYLRNPTVAGYNELIKKMLQSAVIGKFTTALGAITLSDVNAGNIGSYDGAKNWVYASEARDPKFMGRAFKKYIDNQLANPSSALARAVAQAVVPALTRPYVNYKEMLVVLKNETRQYITKYFAAPNGYACNINNVQITVSDFANAVADMVYQSFKVNSEEQLLPTMAGQQQVQVLAGSPRESFR